jgi:hypothetical protein
VLCFPGPISWSPSRGACEAPATQQQGPGWANRLIRSLPSKPHECQSIGCHGPADHDQQQTALREISRGVSPCLVACCFLSLRKSFSTSRNFILPQTHPVVLIPPCRRTRVYAVQAGSPLTYCSLLSLVCKPITLNTQEAFSGSKGSTTPAAQAQLKKHIRTHPERPAHHAGAWASSSRSSTTPSSSRATSTSRLTSTTARYETTKLEQACHHAAQASGQTSRYNTSSAQHAASP